MERSDISALKNDRMQGVRITLNPDREGLDRIRLIHAHNA